MFSYDRESKVLSGFQISPFYHLNVGVGQIIYHYLQREPSRVVQVSYDDGVELTAGEMLKLSTRIAKNLLKQLQLKFGDVVGFVVKNTTYVAPAVLACLFIGTPCSTLDPTFDANEITNIFQQTQPKLVFCDADNYDRVVEALNLCENECQVITVDENVEGIRHVTELLEFYSDEKEFVPQPLPVESYRACGVILCSSGTTGLSKGVMLSNAQCIQMTRLIDTKILNPTILCFSSLYWLSGFTFLIYSLANLSRRVITKRKFTPLLFAHLVEQYHVNVLLMPPSQVVMLVQSPVMKLADLSSVRICFIGGGSLDKEMRETMQDHLLYGALIMTYGMTEVGRIIATTLPFQAPSNSVGKIGPNAKLKVVGEDGGAVGPNEIGEIYLLTQIRFLGYANQPEETTNAFDEQGWFKTGDLGYFNDECEIFIVDRKKEMIKYLNYQVTPSELELHISKIEGIVVVCVVGIKDILAGDLPAAVVVKQANSSLEEIDILDEVARNFPQFKRLHGGVFFVDNMPMTPSGKIKRKAVRELAMRMYKRKEINGNY